MANPRVDPERMVGRQGLFCPTDCRPAAIAPACSLLNLSVTSMLPPQGLDSTGLCILCGQCQDEGALDAR
jgi:hypothetical protein